MLTGILNHNTTKWLIGFALAGVTLSFPMSFLGLTAAGQNKPRPAATARLVQKQSGARIIPDKYHNPLSGKAIHGVGRTIGKLDRPAWVPLQPQGTPGDNLVARKPQPQLPPVQHQNGRHETNIYLLARVIHAEARGEPLEGQVAVGAVLLNRLRDKRFPKTLSQIIFKRGEFCTVRDGQIWMTPGSQAILAARLALSGWDPTGGAVYFYNPAKTTSRWIWSRPVVTKIGHHYFAV